MRNIATQIDSRQARRLLLIQAITTLIIALLLLILGTTPAYSALLGGVTATLANGLFALLVFGSYRAQQPSGLVARFYLGEIVKLLFIGLCFGIAIVWVKPLNIFALLGTFFIIQILPVTLRR